MDPQELLDEFGKWPDTKKFNFIIELARDLTKVQLTDLKALIASWLT